MPTAAIERSLSIVEKKPIHYDFIKQQLPRWLLDTGSQRLTTLKTLKPDISELHTNALTPPLHTAMKQALDKHWSSQNALDKKFAQLNDVQAFAEPLLKEALRAYGDIDVSHTSIRLYAPVNLPWWSINVQPGVTSRTVTLLDAALHNFSASETFADYAFLSDEDARGQRQLLTFTHNVSGQVLTADTFKTLCRSLDIGARYQQQLRTTLGFDNPSVADALRHEVTDNLRAALNSAAHMALAKKHIAEDAYELIQFMVTGTLGRLMLDAKPIEFYTLDLLDIDATVALIIGTGVTGTIEHRETPIGIAAHHDVATAPAQVQPGAFGVAFTVGESQVPRVFRIDPMVDGDRRVAGLAHEGIAPQACAVGQGFRRCRGCRASCGYG